MNEVSWMTMFKMKLMSTCINIKKLFTSMKIYYHYDDPKCRANVSQNIDICIIKYLKHVFKREINQRQIQTSNLLIIYDFRYFIHNIFKIVDY